MAFRYCIISKARLNERSRGASLGMPSNTTYQEVLINTKLKFAFEKETKGAVRYQEVGEDGAPAFASQVGTLYVRKSAMPAARSRKH